MARVDVLVAGYARPGDGGLGSEVGSTVALFRNARIHDHCCTTTAPVSWRSPT